MLYALAGVYCCSTSLFMAEREKTLISITFHSPNPNCPLTLRSEEFQELLCWVG